MSEKYRKWTEQETAYLIEHWGLGTRRAVIAQHVGRSVEACHAKAELLGLRLNGEDWRADRGVLGNIKRESKAA